MIRLDQISRQAGGKTILQDVTLEIPAGKIFTIIGPSGSGKTTLLRAIDLLDPISGGRIFFDNVDVANAGASRIAIRRRMAMVFQKPAVLNTTVEKNVAFGLKFRGIHRQETRERVAQALEIVGLPHLSGRKAVTLSGGEMQRVAIARALVTRPEVLLLDEPTANLDPVNADLIEDLVHRINREFHTTMILSTHDMIQGQRLADRIGVIMNGRLAQVGTIHDIFYRPISPDIARFVGIENVLHGIITGNEHGLALVTVGETVFEVAAPNVSGSVTLYIRPEEITISPLHSEAGLTSVRNRLRGTIKKMVPFGPFIRVTTDCGFPLTALITRRSCEELSLAVGLRVVAGIKASAIHLIAENL